MVLPVQDQPELLSCLPFFSAIRFDPRYPRIIINARNCKYTLISMNNTRVVERNGKFEKDKSSERSNTILPEEATHFGDAADKRMWTKYGNLLVRQSTFVVPRI